MSNKGLRYLSTGLAIVTCIGAVGIYWLLSLSQQDHFVCPPVPTHKTGFAVSSYYEGIRSITFQTTEDDVATDIEKFGWVYDRFDGYTLDVDARYDFQEVLDYLNAWDECHRDVPITISTPTRTPQWDDDTVFEYLSESLGFDLPTQYTFRPGVDNVMVIDWPHLIIITDTFSQTTVISGSATVRFGKGEGQ